MIRHVTLVVGVLAVAFGAGAIASAQTNLPPGRTGGDGSNQAAGPSGQHPGQVGEIGGAGPHPGPQSRKPPAARKAEPPASDR